MPKSAKKRKAKVADFVKPKPKLGRAKRPPSNAIDTSFRARAIALPVQSIATERDQGIPTTKRKLAFDDLLSLVKHHNAGTRRDSVLGFRELFEAHPDLIHQSLSSLFQACARVIADEDASVRKALLSLLTWILPRIPREILIPHSTTLLLFTSSAQTHIYPEIRVDAVRFLDLCLEHFPEVVVEGWTKGANCHGARVLEGYLGMLNVSIMFDDPGGSARATSTLTITLSPASKMIVMQSLSTFLRCALSGCGTSSHTTVTANAWYLASSFSSSDGFRHFHELLSPRSRASPVSCTWKAAPDTEEDFVPNFGFATDPLDSLWTFQQLSDVVSSKGSLTGADLACDAQDAFIPRLAHSMHPVLISTFLDCAPSAFPPSGPTSEVALKLVVATGEIMRSLYSVILRAPNIYRDKARENLRTMLGYMAAYFPFRLTGRCDIKMEESLQNLNIGFCELTSLVNLSLDNASPGANKQRLYGGTQTPKLAFSPQVEPITGHVVQLLREGSGLSHQLRRPLSLGGYHALLPTIWSLLLNNKSLDHRQSGHDVLGAVIEHAIKTPSKAAVKAATIEFMGRLTLMETERSYRGMFKLEQYPEKITDMREWVLHLLKTLWELGNSNMQSTEIILLFLLRLFQRNPCLVNSELVGVVRSRLIPYFIVTHAAKGQLPGPFTRLPFRTVRRLALDVASLLSKPGGNDGLEGFIEQSVAGTEEQSYWCHLHSSRFVT